MSCQAEQCVKKIFICYFFFFGIFLSWHTVLYHFINLEYFSFFKRHWLLVFNGRMK